MVNREGCVVNKEGVWLMEKGTWSTGNGARSMLINFMDTFC